jgi:transposase-like protein
MALAMAKRKNESLETKIAAIEEVEQGCTPKKDIASKYGIKPNTLSTWIKSKDKYKVGNDSLKIYIYFNQCQ